MQNIDYSQVSKFRSLKFDIVQIFLLRYLGPGCCNMWEKEVLFPLVSKFTNYNWYNLYIDQTEIPFPPVNLPAFYIYFKDWKYPFVFIGEKNYNEYLDIFEKISRLNEGIHPTEIFN
jgi:hypothetical protein